MERAGHRSLEGVSSYKRTSDQQKQAVSDVLNRNKSPANSTTTQSPVFHSHSITTLSQQQLGHSLSLPSASFKDYTVQFYIGTTMAKESNKRKRQPNKRKRQPVVIGEDSDSD